jgi:mannose-6-phosphate isomerase-like protein (cupin superfamily)
MGKVTSYALADALRIPLALDLAPVRERLERAGGGVQILHVSPGLEVRVEVLDAPGPGALRVEPGDTLYTVLAGTGLLGTTDNDPLALTPGEAALVPAGTRHVVFGNPRLSMLVVTAPVPSIPTASLALCRRH